MRARGQLIAVCVFVGGGEYQLVTPGGGGGRGLRTWLRASGGGGEPARHARGGRVTYPTQVMNRVILFYYGEVRLGYLFILARLG